MVPREGTSPQTSHGAHGTRGPCEVCGGRCRAPFRLPSLPTNYAFLPPEVIAAVNEANQPTEPPAEPAPTRGRRRGEDRARRLDEHNARTPGDDR